MHRDSSLFKEPDVLQEVLDAIPDMVIIIDPEYRILLVNREFCHNYGLENDEVIGVPYYRIVHGHDIAKEDCSCTVALVSTIHEKSEFSRFKRTYATTAHPIFLDGKIAALVHTFKDITDLRERARQKAITETVGAVSHELTQPLQIVLANVSLLTGCAAELPDAVRERLAIIEESVTNMGALIRKLQNLSGSGPVELIPYEGGDRILDINRGEAL